VTIQGQILFEMQKLTRETGAAMIWITHDLSVVAGLADRVCVMKRRGVKRCLMQQTQSRRAHRGRAYMFDPSLAFVVHISAYRSAKAVQPAKNC